ncbi:MAG: UDP-N-acetylmuramate--L-alanine ligase [Deltaproteobacteria bacterium]|nr:UDP-N-acetylmuramate--L-alanine ligase [Deltaproteobacteria bacterium]
MKSVHFIGICGSGMASLAGLCKAVGWKVTGSDTAFYPPMGEMIRSLDIPCRQGWDPKNIEKPDFVVVGNVCTKDNIEVQAAMEKNIPYFSLPQALQEFFLKNKKALVVCGTHGKTTTTNLLAWVLTSAGKKPGFFAGGIGNNFGTNFALGEGEFFVLEGDEYSASFFDKGPKFAHFRPFGAILTSIEWDHIDIYPTVENFIGAFQKFFSTLSKESILLACAHDQQISKMTTAPAYRLQRYGQTTGDIRAKNIETSLEGTTFTLISGQEEILFSIPLTGTANLENTLAVAGLCRQLGLSWDEIRKGLSTFKGVKKRQEIKGVVKGITVIDDFAHHPTAIRVTIDALRKRFKGARLTIVFEPRSNTSRRNAHYKEYLQSFRGANRVLLAPIYKPEKIPPAERLNTEQLANDLMRKGIEAFAIPDHDSILEFIIRSIGPGEVVAFFSNGDFNNIHEKLLQKLERRKIFTDKKQVRSIQIKK